MNKRKYKLNANKNSIEKDDKYFAYFNIIDAHKITRELNRLHEENKELKKLLKKNDVDFRWHQNYQEFDKDELYIKDNNTEIRLKNRNLFINIFVPDINEYFKINYVVVARKLARWWDK